VALSRVKNLDNLYLTGINRLALAVSPDAQQIDEILRSRAAKDVKKFEHLNKKANERKYAPQEKKKGNSDSGWSDKIAKMRESYPNAYKPWQANDDELLKQEFQNGVSIKELSKKLGRHEGSITMRLQKHFGEDVVV
jgi:ATP-dependent DNA helicase PIF1